MEVAASQKTLYVGKSMSRGPKMITSKMNLLKTKATIPMMTTAKVDRIKCHLNSSRWSKKDISSGDVLLFAIIKYLRL